MTGNITAVTGCRIIDPGASRISVTGLDDDIGRRSVVKMNAGPVGKAVVTNRAITLVSTLRVATYPVRPDVFGKRAAVRRKVMAGNAAGWIGDRVHNMATGTCWADTALKVDAVTESAHRAEAISVRMLVRTIVVPRGSLPDTIRWMRGEVVMTTW